jgi:predicted glycoside hydrolase/deacetylase ChbG (UPF0249 family)
VVRRLIINADDFGLTHGINRGIAEAHLHGLVTSATLMAVALGFNGAVELARANPELSVGCHLVLVDGEETSASTSSRQEANERRPSVRRRLADFTVRALRGLISPSDLRAQIRTQIVKLQRAGVPVSHVDTHLHTHIFPVVFKPLLQAASECGVRAVRNPFGPLKALAFAHLMRRPRLWTHYSEIGWLRGLAAGFRKAVAAAGMVTPDGSFGVIGTGAFDERLFEAIIGCMPEGTWEFVCHPGYCDPELLKRGGRLRQRREQEIRVLTSQPARKILQKHGVELISYHELLAASSSAS